MSPVSPLRCYYIYIAICEVNTIYTIENFVIISEKIKFILEYGFANIVLSHKMPRLLRNGGLYYHMQQRLHNMHLVYPLFGMVRARNSRESKSNDKSVLKHIGCCIFLRLSYLFFLSFPRFSKNLRKVDSSECCVRKKPMQKRRTARLHDFPECVRPGSQSVHAQRRFKDSSCFERNHEDQRKCRSCHKEKICARSRKHRNTRRRAEKNEETSQICNRQIEHSNSHNKSEDSLNMKNSENANLKAHKSEYSICKRS